MSNRLGSLKKNIHYISPSYYRPTKEMIEKYEKYWLPLRNEINEKNKRNKKIFLLYGDFEIVEIENKKSNKSSKSNKLPSSKTRKLKNQIIKGKKRTWTIKNN